MPQDRPIHFIVEEGPDRGREISVRPEGVRIGRSKGNDVALSDPVMSRFHCRVFFKPDEGLWVEDLGSANNTLLNGVPVHMNRMKPGDRLTLGDSVLRVVSDAYPTSSAAHLFSSAEPLPGESKFRRPPPGDNQRRKSVLYALLALAAGLAVIGLMYKNFSAPPEQVQEPLAVPDTSRRLEIYYEKIEASPKNIFRYELELSNGELSVQIDDLANKRHVAKNQRKKIDPELIRSLGESIVHSDFTSLKELYKGSIDDIYDLWDLTVTIGNKSHRVKVLNSIEPENFRKAREAIEEFAQNEIGLSALALTREKLLELAKSAALLGRNLYDQREVKRENLALAIRSIKECEWYLETIDPKPDYYADSVALRRECERELDEEYQKRLFLAERAIKLKEWSEAASHLRILLEKIPDRSDERHKNANKKLIDVERHLKKK